MCNNRLLIVDDHPSMGELVARIGTAAGFAVAVTQCVDDFLEQLRAFNPSVVTLDLLMPGTDGVELLAKLAAQNCAAKIILMSGTDGPMLDVAHTFGEDLGLQVAGALSKPFRAASLQALFEGLKT